MFGRAMAARGPEELLLGRRNECEVLDRLLAAVPGRQSGVLVLRGEPGVGKSALLEYAIKSASGLRVMRSVGVESEMELPFAALQVLCGPMQDRLERLPGPQRDALGVAFGLSPGEAPDRFLVGLAMLSVLSEVAEEQPLLCVVDDAQWLDRASAQALAFVARRLLAEPIAFIFAARECSDELTGLPELLIHGLRNGDARALLSSVLPVRLDERVQARIVAETHGNPLALLELPRGLTSPELAGEFGLPGGLPLPGRIEESFRRRLAMLPPDTRQLLLVAAAEAVGDPVLVWRAAGRLGIDVSAADAAETDGLLEVGAGLTFRHPLVRSAAYRAGSLPERRAAHRALAEVTDPQVDPDRRAWHRAQGTSGPDDDVASDLERSADRAQARGGLAAAGAFLERAAALTLEPARRAERALAAAQAKHQAGAFDAAVALVATAEAGPLNEFQRAQVDVLRAQIAFASSRGSDAPPLLLKAAKRLESLDVTLAREIHLDALAAGLFAGRLARGAGALEVAEAVRAAPRPSERLRAPDLLLDGLALQITAGHAAGAPVLKRALTAFSSEEISIEEGLRWLWISCHAAGLLWDYESWDLLSARNIGLAREAGALSVLPNALNTRAGVHLFAGELGHAASLADEVDAVNDATGSSIAPYAALGLAAFRGREPEASELIEAATKEVLRRGEGVGLTFVQWVSAVLYNGLGRYEDALVAAQQAGEDSHEMRFATWGLVELIEAAERSGKPERAADALERLSQTTAAVGSDWARGIEARSQALVSDGDAAETFYRQAIEVLGRSRLRAELARAHLLYGEWLRRERRRLDAREQLRSAHELFTAFGMEAFAQRTRIELEATGEHARKRSVETRDDLTSREAQISRLAAEGATNPQIAARLFISKSTVDYHLRKAFRKLGVKSRTQLARHMLDSSAG
jgi:DNA-binding CsgD family transcriptional regulator